jgi:hypothetical protein
MPGQPGAVAPAAIKLEPAAASWSTLPLRFPALSKKCKVPLKRAQNPPLCAATLDQIWFSTSESMANPP